MRVKLHKVQNMILLLLGVAMYLVSMLLTDQTAWHAYFFMFALGGFVYAAYRPASPFYPPLMLYLWFSVFNFRTIALLHIGQEGGAKYFTYTILPQAWHYQVMIQEQFMFALPMLFISIFLAKKTLSPMQYTDFYSFSKRYWYVFYIMGLLAIAYLILRGGGLEAASYSRKARVIGAGWAVVSQYLLILGIGLFIIAQKHKSMSYHLLMAASLSFPAILTQERSFVMAIIFGVLAYHSIFTRQLKLRQLAIFAPLLAFAALAMGLYRTYLLISADAADRGFFDALTGDATFGTGYLLFRELGIDFEPPLTTLLLTFSFFSSGIKALLGDLPISPNAAFSQAMFPGAAASNTFSMGLLGEAHYLFGDYRILYYLGIGILLHLLCDFVARRDPLMLMFIAGFIFRVAKGGVTGGMIAVWIMIILLMIVRLIDFIFTAQKGKKVLHASGHPQGLGPPTPPEA